MAKDPNKLQQAIDQARGRVSDAKDAIAGSDTASSLKSTLSSGADKVSDVTGKVRERLPDVTPITSGVQSPIGLVLGFAAAGVIAGLALPLTEYERERLEPIGGDLAQRAIGARDEILEQGRQVVAETVSAARDSVQKHGQDLASSLGVSAGETDADETKTAPAQTPQGATSGSGSAQPGSTGSAKPTSGSTPSPAATPSAPPASATQSAKSTSSPGSSGSSAGKPGAGATSAAGGTSAEVNQAAQRLSDASNTRDALQKSGIIKPPGSSST